jgi:hypothetical protein
MERHRIAERIREMPGISVPEQQRYGAADEVRKMTLPAQCTCSLFLCFCKSYYSGEQKQPRSLPSQCGGCVP